MARSTFRAAQWVASAAAGLLCASCWLEMGFESDSETGPPLTAFVWIDSVDSKVDTTSVNLTGEAECDDCPPPTGWEYQRCPAISCPIPDVDVSWRNDTTGASGPAGQAVAPSCHCPIVFNGYCYSACDHSWWATVPLVLGTNHLTVSATGPGLATGTDSADVERVPLAPAWLPAQLGAGQVTLAWSAVDSATSYNLYWSTTPYYWAALCEKIAGVTSPYTHTGLSSGVTYYYFVTAVAGGSESFDSVRLQVTPP